MAVLPDIFVLLSQCVALRQTLRRKNFLSLLSSLVTTLLPLTILTMLVIFLLHPGRFSVILFTSPSKEEVETYRVKYTGYSSLEGKSFLSEYTILKN